MAKGKQRRKMQARADRVLRIQSSRTRHHLRTAFGMRGSSVIQGKALENIISELKSK